MFMSLGYVLYLLEALGGLFSSVGRALDSKSKGHRFNSGKGQSAHITYGFTSPAIIL